MKSEAVRCQSARNIPCRSTFRTATGSIVVTRQVIAFEDGGLAHHPEADVEFVRAMTAGIGDYAAAPVEIRQTPLGMTDGYGVRLQMASPENPA